MQQLARARGEAGGAVRPLLSAYKRNGRGPAQNVALPAIRGLMSGGCVAGGQPARRQPRRTSCS